MRSAPFSMPYEGPSPLLTPNPAGIAEFRRVVLDYYQRNGRTFAWRETSDPYRILVSEVMLQQTQVDRVAPKYALFLEKFPTIEALAGASMKAVLELWRGLGYNRRAMSLHSLAGVVVADFGGALPRSRADLLKLPGVGPSTAGAIMTFAFQLPAAFIETNIRRVFIHFFFPERDLVPDKEILPLVEKTLDKSDMRSWYYALMDYGAMLGKSGGANPNRKSAHYRKQSPFSGSDREIRGLIVRTLLETGPLSHEALLDAVGKAPARVLNILERLILEGMAERSGEGLAIREHVRRVQLPRDG